MRKSLGRVPLEGQASVEALLTRTGITLLYTNLQGHVSDIYLSPEKCIALGSMLLQAGQRHEELTDVLQNFEDCRVNLNRRENEYLEGWMHD